jgi:hypothetical protein
MWISLLLLAVRDEDVERSKASHSHGAICNSQRYPLSRFSTSLAI